MPLETTTYIDGLVSTNPIATDPVSAADDHMRLIKAAVKATFPNIAGAITPSHTTINRGAVPVGTIVLWSGAVSAVPAGWAICDGTNGTPNLTGKFVRHADADAAGTHNVGETGGAATDAITTSSDGAHTHTALAGGDHDHGAATGSTAIDETQIPAHNHRIMSGSGGGDTNSWPEGTEGIAGMDTQTGTYVEAGDTGSHIEDTGGGLGHDHTISASGTHTHTTDSQGAHTHTATVDTVPPFHALAFIMRIAD